VWSLWSKAVMACRTWSQFDCRTCRPAGRGGWVSLLQSSQGLQEQYTKSSSARKILKAYNLPMTGILFIWANAAIGRFKGDILLNRNNHT